MNLYDTFRILQICRNQCSHKSIPWRSLKYCKEWQIEHSKLQRCHTVPHLQLPEQFGRMLFKLSHHHRGDSMEALDMSQECSRMARWFHRATSNKAIQRIRNVSALYLHRCKQSFHDNFLCLKVPCADYKPTKGTNCKMPPWQKPRQRIISHIAQIKQLQPALVNSSRTARDIKYRYKLYYYKL